MIVTYTLRCSRNGCYVKLFLGGDKNRLSAKVGKRQNLPFTVAG